MLYALNLHSPGNDISVKLGGQSNLQGKKLINFRKKKSVNADSWHVNEAAKLDFRGMNLKIKVLRHETQLCLLDSLCHLGQVIAHQGDSVSLPL